MSESITAAFWIAIAAAATYAAIVIGCAAYDERRKARKRGERKEARNRVRGRDWGRGSRLGASVVGGQA